MFKHIAIIGAGPAGCALACFLQQRGLRVTVFDDDKKPELLVGESLVPAVMPILKRLGLEEQVAAISSIKRGAALRHENGARVDFEFRKFGRDYPNFAYNIPRPKFDCLVRDRARSLGATIVPTRARFTVDLASTDRPIRLSADTLKAAGFSASDEPDLIVDATGRTRAISKLLKVPATRGPRNDVAHFAHFENFSSDSELPGQVVLSVLEHGWSWQIPLPGRTSVGVVIDQHAAASYGSTAEQRLNTAIENSALLSAAGAQRTQLTPAMTYANYQLIAAQASGPGWLLLGDALGFVDPMLSPGVFMALESAQLVDRYLFAKPLQSPLNYQQAANNYFSEVKAWHAAWGELIEYFYNGRILLLGEQRSAIRASGGFSFSKAAESIVSRSLAQMVGGIATRSRLKQAALRHTCKHLLTDATELSNHRIQSAQKLASEKAA